MYAAETTDNDTAVDARAFRRSRDSLILLQDCTCADVRLNGSLACDDSLLCHTFKDLLFWRLLQF